MFSSVTLSFAFFYTINHNFKGFFFDVLINKLEAANSLYFTLHRD
jgi:hypothetical protein